MNERLEMAGLLEQSDEAFRRRERQQLVALLKKVEINGPGAERTADDILNNLE